MIYIAKNPEPISLTLYKKDDNSSYSNFSNSNGKLDVKQSLLDEQGYICAYCMDRINDENIRIEHIEAQSNNRELDLDYSNMIGVCKGSINNQRYCENNRGNTHLKVNPLDIKTLKEICYTKIGEIFSNDEVINTDIDITLNLNIQHIKENRKRTYLGVKQILIKKSPENKWSKELIQKELNKWKNKQRSSSGKDQLEPYCGIVIYFLEKELSKI